MRPGKGNIVFEMKTLDGLMRRYGDATFRKLDDDGQLTRMHHWIIGYLYDRQDQDVFQRDIESAFKISRSTTSSMLSLMEKKGLVNRTGVPGDARLKKITLTERAKELHVKHVSKMQEMDEAINSAITPEEKAELIRILDKLREAIRERLAGVDPQTENDGRNDRA